MLSGVLDGLLSVLVAMGGADVSVMGFGCVQIVVVGIGAGVREPFGLAFFNCPKQAQTSTSGCSALISPMISATLSTSRLDGPRPLATRQTRCAPPAIPASAAATASSFLSHRYFKSRLGNQAAGSSRSSPLGIALT